MTDEQANSIGFQIFSLLGEDSLKQAYRKVDRAVVSMALEACNNDPGLTAQRLKLNRTTLLMRRKLHGFPVQPPSRNPKYPQGEEP